MTKPLASTGGPMFSREELLGGLPARRASTVLFAIEGATARLVAGSRINRAAYIAERTSAEREQEFLKAIATGGDLPRPPTIADLERFSSGWASLVPVGGDARAAVARLLGSKYRFRRTDVPGLRAALSLDTAELASAFERLHRTPVDTIYVADLPVADRLRWAVARLSARFDRLPPFWIAFFLALAETLGEGIMSVPLALAGLGPLPGVVLLLVLGLANLVTMGAMTEAVIRSGNMRYGAAYFTRLVTDLLGRVPATTLAVALGLLNILTFFVYFLGFGSVLAGATGVPIGVWIVLLLAVNIVILRNETLDDSIASAVLIGTVNLGLVIMITAIALMNVDPANLAYANVPLLNGQPIDAAVVGLVFGIVLVAFFGHTAAANASKLVLTLEPSGRSLLWGNLAALATVIVLYCVAAVAIIGVVGQAPLVGTNGTAITPLAEAVGPVISVLGSLYVVLAVGIGSLYVTLGTYNQVIELLPRPAAVREDWLGRIAATRRGRLIVGFAPAALVCLALEFVVLTGQDDFAGPIGIGGALAVPLITGIFPMLLIVAARRKGEYVPGRVIGLLGHPVVVVAILGLFTIALAAHGLVIWDGPVERIAALAVTAVCIGLIAWVVRGGVLRPRAIVEVRIDRRQGRTTMSITGSGRSIVSDAAVDGVTPRSATADLPGGAWRELRVWPHEVTADGWSVGLPANVELATTAGVVRRHLAAADPDVIPVDGAPTVVRVELEEATHG